MINTVIRNSLIALQMPDLILVVFKTSHTEIICCLYLYHNYYKLFLFFLVIVFMIFF